jgi:predicted amidohydrolase
MAKPAPTSPGHSTLRVAAAQLKFRPTLRGNIERIESMIGRAADRGADVVLLPECATTGYAIDFRTLDRSELRDGLLELGSLAGKYGIHVLAGTPWFNGRRLQNSLVVFDRSGRAVYQYSKCHLTPRDRETFTPGNALALFDLDGIPATALICHERRYPELVRLPVMAGARIIFHPNAGLDSLAVSRKKRGGRDGVAARAFENAVPYVFANSVGPQGGGLWSAGDSKIVDADSTVLQLADNASETLLIADLDLSRSTRKYAVEALSEPRFLARSLKSLVTLVRRQARAGILRNGIDG